MLNSPYFIKYPPHHYIVLSWLQTRIPSQAPRRDSAVSTGLNRNSGELQICNLQKQWKMKQWTSVYPPTRPHDSLSTCILICVYMCTRACTHTYPFSPWIIWNKCLTLYSLKPSNLLPDFAFSMLFHSAGCQNQKWWRDFQCSKEIENQMLIHKTTKQNKLDKQKHIAKPIHNPAGLRQSNQVWQSSHWGGPILSKAQSLWTESIFLPVLIQ